jgi:histidinol phosphatase-like PHP family hydrolase
MIDLHMHTLFSDGVLLPFELMRRAYIAGCRAIAITDHVDSSNIDFVIPRIVEAISDVAGTSEMTVLPGAEITHAPPRLIGKLVARARELGAKVVVVHGETTSEPVVPGTNSAGIDAGADILSHPGLITREEALKARDSGNGHVFKTAMESGADLVVNSDAHSPEDLITQVRAKVVLRGAGVPDEMVDAILANSQKIVDRVK